MGKDHNKAMRKLQRETLKEIESFLHPCPLINDYEIIHEHIGRKIIFTAWKNGTLINQRSIAFDREYVLASSIEFYNNNLLDILQWLLVNEQ